MKTYHSIVLALALVVFRTPAVIAEPTKAQPPANWAEVIESQIDMINASGSSDFTAACFNLARDVKDKRLKVYAVVPTAKIGVTNVAEFSVEVIYHRDFANALASGTYQQHYNHCLLDFAGAQFSDGKKVLGLRLVRLLAEAEPNLSWSSSDIPSLPIKDILTGMESDNGKLSNFLKEATRDWRQRERLYKP